MIIKNSINNPYYQGFPLRQQINRKFDDVKDIKELEKLDNLLSMGKAVDFNFFAGMVMDWENHF